MNNGLKSKDRKGKRIIYDNHGKGYLWISIVKQNESSDYNIVYMIWYVVEIDKYAIYLPIAFKMINSFGFKDKF